MTFQFIVPCSSDQLGTKPLWRWSVILQWEMKLFWAMARISLALAFASAVHVKSMWFWIVIIASFFVCVFVLLFTVSPFFPSTASCFSLFFLSPHPHPPNTCFHFIFCSFSKTINSCVTDKRTSFHKTGCIQQVKETEINASLFGFCFRVLLWLYIQFLRTGYIQQVEETKINTSLFGFCFKVLPWLCIPFVSLVWFLTYGRTGFTLQQ